MVRREEPEGPCGPGRDSHRSRGLDLILQRSSDSGDIVAEGSSGHDEETRIHKPICKTWHETLLFLLFPHVKTRPTGCFKGTIIFLLSFAGSRRDQCRLCFWRDGALWLLALHDAVDTSGGFSHSRVLGLGAWVLHLLFFRKETSQIMSFTSNLEVFSFVTRRVFMIFYGYHHTPHRPVVPNS